MIVTRIAASLMLVVLVSMSTCVAHAGESTAAVPPQTVTRIAKIAGSVIQATVRSVDKVTPPGPTGLEEVTAVCITSGSDASQCGQSATLAQAGCGASDKKADPGKSSPACDGNKTARTQHVALCDAEDVGLSGCLSKYATSLVRHPGIAEKAYQFSVRRDDRNLPDITVLVTAKQTEEDAAQMALDSMTSTRTASSH
jgi:hypothetical protein